MAFPFPSIKLQTILRSAIQVTSRRAPRFNQLLAIALVSHGIICAGQVSQSENLLPNGILDSLAVLPTTKTFRISSWDRTGGNEDYITVHPGETISLAEIAGAGIIHRFYVATAGADRMRFRKSVLRMYWDGAAQPDVETPLGDFFGCGMGTLRTFQSLVVNVNPSDAGWDCGGMSSYFAMPFASGARITLENDGSHPFFIWYHVEYETVPSVTLTANLGRFHAQWRRVDRTPIPPGIHSDDQLNGTDRNLSGADNYVILDAEGHGTLVGFFLTVDNLQPGWYGEGDDMIFIDGEKWPPSYSGTGHEEVFDSGGGVNVEFAGPYTGFYLVENQGRKYGGKNQMYRFFINNPVHFQKSIRVTLEHGNCNNRENDYTTTAFWYQKDPHSAYPALPSAKNRAPSWPGDVSATIESEAVAMESKMQLDTSAAATFSAIQEKLQKDFQSLRYADYTKDVKELEAFAALHRSGP
jgi:hypothetical protein